MLTEANKAFLINHLEKNVEWRYPLDGLDQYKFNIPPFVYRRGEPISKTYPAIEISFLPRSDVIVKGLADVVKYTTGGLVYGYGELEPIIITAYTQQMSEGSGDTVFHGKLVADAWIRRIERYVHRYWPRMLQGMEAYIYRGLPFMVEDIGVFLAGDEKQGFELTFHIISTNKWDFRQDSYTGAKGDAEDPTAYFFEDATFSGATEQEISGGLGYTINLSISGEMHDR